MNDMRAVIVPKSDQINADDLLGGPITITVREVSIRPGTEQPVSIHFEGDGGKPYKPCKSMARVMVHCWGPDANQYVGRSMTLYCDPKVMWGGMAVGGIRISHMTDIKAAQTMALTATKGKRAPFVVQPLKVSQPTQTETQQPKAPLSTDEWLARLQTRLDSCQELAAVEEIAASKGVVGTLAKAPDEVKAKINGMLDAARGRFSEIVADDTPASDDTFADAAE